MRKFFVFVVIALLCSSVAFASVGVKKDGVIEGNATYVDIKSGLSEFNGNTVSLYANGYKEGATTNVSGESNLTSAALAYGIIKLADTGALDGSDARYIALANGTAGQMITIQQVADTGGTLYITDDKVASAVFPMTKTGWDDIAFADIGDTVTLLYVDDTIGWIVVGYYGVVLTF